MFSDPKSRSVRYVWLLNLIPYAGLGLVYGGGPKVLPYLLFLWFLEMLSPAFRDMMVPLYFLLSIVGSVMLLAKQGKFNSMNSQDLSLYEIQQMRKQRDERQDGLEAESGLGIALAKERQQRIQKLRELIETWQQRATMAVQQGNDPLAKEALRRKDQFIQELAALRKDDAKKEQRETDDEKSNFAFDTFEHKVQAAQKQMAARQANEAKQASQPAATLRAAELNLDEEQESPAVKAGKPTSPLGSIASPDAGASIILNSADKDALAIQTKLGADVVASSKLNSLDFSPKPMPRPVEPPPVHTTGADALAGSFDSSSAGGSVASAFDASGAVADSFADTTSSSSAQNAGSSAADPFDTKGTVDPFADTNKSSDPFADSNNADSTVNASTDSAAASDHGAAVLTSFSASGGASEAFNASLDSSSTFADANSAADPFASVNSATDSVMADIAKADPFAGANEASSPTDGFSSAADPFAATGGANDSFAAEAGLSDPFADEAKPQVVKDGATVPPIVSALVAQSSKAGIRSAASNTVATASAASSSTDAKIASSTPAATPTPADASSGDYVSSPYLSSVFGEESNSSSAASFASASALRNDDLPSAASNAVAGASGASSSTVPQAASGTGSASQSSSTANPNDYVSSAYVSSVFGEDSNSSSAASFASASALRNEPTIAAPNAVAGDSGSLSSTNQNTASGTVSASQSSPTLSPNDYVSSAYVSSVFGEDSNSSSSASFASASALRNEPTTSATPPESDHPYGSSFDSSYSTPTFDLPTFNFSFDSGFGSTSAAGSDPATATSVSSAGAVSAAKANDLVCPKCGAIRDKNFSFCISCGQNYK